MNCFLIEVGLNISYLEMTINSFFLNAVNVRFNSDAQVVAYMGGFVIRTLKEENICEDCISENLERERTLDKIYALLYFNGSHLFLNVHMPIY